MSKSWPRHGIIKFAGTVMDGARDGAYGLLDCFARVDGKARETVVALLGEEEAKDTAVTRESARHAQAQAEELARVYAELVALHKKIDRLAGTPQPAQKPSADPADSRSPVAHG
ncbi:hypothetical protein OG413_28450 [Streptomyces sp. NBC_01433]|uniref:hypothetical protein n=1 Tax=Streptomyces sp. NBC_01433 TaxID=2903864 RepID=UPI0022579A94|nr:hypothetical protein [Streptomyces sp. NBC_01433]MCX4679187.1 hypothetical protein [Streptomyces sp. NBC_01433]